MVILSFIFLGAIKHFLLANNYVSVTPYEYHHFSNDQKYSLGLEAYRQQMPESMEDQVTFEGSPGYYPTWKSIRRIYSMNPCVKLITVFIDPVERLISHYAHITAKDLPDAYVNGVKSTSFHNYYFDINGDIRERATGISEGMYGIHMERWLNYFPLERIHVVDGAVLKTEPWLEMQKLEQFLDVPIMSKKRKFVYRSDGKVFCHVKIGCLAKSKGRVHPNVSETDKRSLKAMYRGSDDYFFQLIKRKLSWAPVAWWRHQIETSSALLALCAGNSPVTGEFPTHKGQWREALIYFV